MTDEQALLNMIDFLTEENNKLRKAILDKIEEDSDYCKEYSAVLVLQDENKALRQTIDELRKVINGWTEENRPAKKTSSDPSGYAVGSVISSTRDNGK